MKTNNAALVLRLKSPIQSWGTDSRFLYVRSTQTMPSKSGVIGMIFAAEGIDKYSNNDKEKEALQEMRSLNFFFAAIQPNKEEEEAKNKKLPQNSSVFREYQTVGGGYNKEEAIERNCIPVTTEGKFDGCKTYERYYLQDADFIVILEGDKTKLEKIKQALENPKWGIWFGTKCCTPSTPIVEGIFDSSEAFFNQNGGSKEKFFFEHARSQNDEIKRSQNDEIEIFPKTYRIVRKHCSAKNFSETSAIWLDEPLSFSERKYASRSIHEDFY